MPKIKVFFTAATAAGVLLFALEAVSYWIFRDVYKAYFGPMLNTGINPVFGLKLLAADLGAGLLTAMVYDLFYRAIPGGFIRKGMSFAFILWALQAAPAAIHLYAATNNGSNFLFITLLQYLFIDIIIGFVLTGVYNEFYLRMDAPEKAAAGEVPEAATKEGKKGRAKNRIKTNGREEEDDEKDNSDNGDN